VVGKTVLVVGVGRFGSHYARILSGLRADRCAGVPALERLVLTRTRREPSRRLAEEIRSDPNCTAGEVIGVPVADHQALAAVVKRFSPDLTCITALDPETGDAIHGTYAETVLRNGKGSLLCEKPLCPTAGDGKSIWAVRRLERAGGSERFGLELPMAVVRRQAETNPELSRRLTSARRLCFFWSTTAPLRADLIDTLALHPWSLIPEPLTIERLESRRGSGRCDITGRLRNRQTGAGVALAIALCGGENVRTMRIDESLFTIASRGPTVSILPEPTDAKSGSAHPLLTVQNPLKQNIVASLSGTPITDLVQTEAAQRFLETAKGWQGG
jgi:hypothetical protein